MIGSLIDGIAGALRAEFGDGYEIYEEQIRQGLQPPCFYVSCVDSQQNRFMGNVFRAEHRFLVLFFPRGENANRECMEIADRLRYALEVIDCKYGKIRGTGMQAEVRDGLLNFSLTYKMDLRQEAAEIEKMEHLEGRYKGV